MNNKIWLKPRNIKGIMWMVISCFWVAIMSALIRYISDDMNVYMINFLRCTIATIILLTWLKIRNKKQFHIPRTKFLKTHFMKAIISYASILIWMYAISITPLTQISAIDLVAPIFTMIMAVIFLKEKLSIYRVIGTVSAIFGALIIIRPGTEAFNIGCMLAIISNFLYAASLIMSKNLSHHEGNKSIGFYTFLILSILSLPLAIYHWQTPSISQLLCIVALAQVSILFYFSILYAFKVSDIVVVIPFEFTSIIFTSIIAYIAFDEIIDFWTISGALVILLSVIYITAHESMARKKIEN